MYVTRLHAAQRNRSRHAGSTGIIELRRKRGWTQQAFAERMGYSRNYQHRVEKGSENLQVESLVGLANTLGVSMSELFEPPSRKIVRRSGKPRRDQT